LVKDLPRKDLINLQTKSGAIPPSRGFIVDRNGQVITEAVGYGDDHYLPFNLKNISRLKGGEYVRTRTLGGPTTEDIYAGLVSGARSVTIVSRSGIYTVEFDDTFRGSRRYNDKAARMVARYGMILDAVNSGQVTLEDIPGDRMQELRLQAAELYPDESGDGFSGELDRLKNNERRRPQMSEARRKEAAREFLRDKAALIQTPDGRELGYEDMVEQLVRRDVAGIESEAKAFSSMYGGDMPESTRAALDTKRAEVRAKYSDPERVVATMNLDDEFDRRMQVEMDKYVASQRPLRLDGSGYSFALDAMKEQFPYYVKSVSYRKITKEQQSGQEDVGYVKPRFTRPAGVRAGYFDESITGAGKINADLLNYQNVGVREAARGRTRNVDSESPENRGANRGPGVGDSTARRGMDSIAPELDDRLRNINSLRNKLKEKTVAEKQGVINSSTIVAGTSLNAEGFKQIFPYTSRMSDLEIERAFNENPDAVEAAVAREVLSLSNILIFDSETKNLLSSVENKGNVKFVKFNVSAPPVREYKSGNVKFDFGSELYQPNIALERMRAFASRSEEVNRVRPIITQSLEIAGVEGAEIGTQPYTMVVKSLADRAANKIETVQRNPTNYLKADVDKINSEFFSLVATLQLSENIEQATARRAKEESDRQNVMNANPVNPNIAPRMVVLDADDSRDILRQIGFNNNEDTIEGEVIG
jgi:hypothetical protein